MLRTIFIYHINYRSNGQLKDKRQFIVFNVNITFGIFTILFTKRTKNYINRFFYIGFLT